MDYPTIDIKDMTYGVSVKKTANKITKHLAIAFANAKYNDRRIKIYSIFGHREIMPQAIETLDDAIQFCKFFEALYGDYWDIHRVDGMEDFDIIQVAQYSVDNGVAVFEALKKLENRTSVLLCDLADRDTITFTEFQREMENIQ